MRIAEEPSQRRVAALLAFSTLFALVSAGLTFWQTARIEALAHDASSSAEFEKLLAASVRLADLSGLTLCMVATLTGMTAWNLARKRSPSAGAAP
ncbi:MAG: hypothetical protein PVI30_08660 [Myxococcales bacterium]|jgi:hypothetical protein